jgi:predicted PurR-regulated permease PerM
MTAAATPFPGHHWLTEVVLSRRWATFIVLGLAFFCFGAGTLNLFELLLTGYASVAAYVVLKVCEYTLVRQIGSTHGRVQPE